MDIVWLLHGDVLSQLQRALQSRSQGVGVDTPVNARKRVRRRVSLETFVKEVYLACLAGGSDQQRPCVAFTGMRECHSTSQGRQFVEKLCVLFDLVDIDGTGVIDWTDFTDFCVHMRGGKGEHGGGHQGLEDDDKGDSSRVDRHEDEEKNYTRFTERRYIDRSSHCHEMRSMRFSKVLQLLMVVEGGPVVKIYQAGPYRVGAIEPAIAMKKKLIESTSRSLGLTQAGRKRGAINSSVRRGSTSGGPGNRGFEDKTSVLAAEFLGHDNQAIMSCADGFLTVWDVETCRMLRSTCMRDVQVGLHFCLSLGLLASWGVDDFNHEVIMWDVEELKVVHVLNDGHSEAVKDVCEVAPKEEDGDSSERLWDPMLATAGMDGKVVMWDLRRGSDRKFKAPRKLFILLGHIHGILSLAYSNEHDLIISAGFDYNAFCWERSTGHMHMKLNGHRRPLIGVVIVRHETQRAVTGDEGGNFRLWEIQRGPSENGTCLQTFSLSNPRAMPRTMVVSWREGLITAGSKMHIFRAEPSMTVDATPAGAWFSPYTAEFCVLLRDAVILDASDGKILRRAFQQVPGREITTFCVDARHKKAVVGDQKGDLRVYDGVTGRMVMSATPHYSEVSAILFIDESNTFISAGWDRRIQVHDAMVCSSASVVGCQHSQAGKAASKPGSVPMNGHRCAKLLRSVARAHEGDITLLAASASLGLLATASSDLTVRLWDYSLLRLEEIIVAHRQEISCIYFLDPLPCLATADMSSKVLIWATRPHPNAGCLLAIIRNTEIATAEIPKGAGETLRHTRPIRKVLPTPVTSIAFLHSNSRAKTAQASELDARQDNQQPANRAHARKITGDHAPACSVGHGRADVSMDSVSGDPRSILITGDELGFIKIWDITNVLTDTLGSVTCGATSTAAEAAVATSTVPNNKKSHQFVYHRDNPLEGVSICAAARFKELIEISKILREGGTLPLTQEEADSKKLLRHVKHGNISVCTGENRQPRVEPNPSLIAELSVKSKEILTSGTQPEDRSGGSGSAFQTSSYTLSEPNRQRPCHHLAAKQADDVYAEVEAILNAQVDAIDAVSSWAGHSNSITSLQVILDPLSLVTGSLDGSARVFSLGGSQLGTLIDQNKSGLAPWIFKPPSMGRKTLASARAAPLQEQLDISRRTQRCQFSGVSGDEKPGKIPRVLTVLDQEVPPSIPAPANGSAVSSIVLDTRERDRGGIRGGGDTEPVSSGGVAANTSREIGRLDGRLALSFACLSRINEFARPADAAQSQGSETASGGQNNDYAPQESIDASLMNEAREGPGYQPKRVSYPNRPSTARVAMARGARHLGDNEGWLRNGGEPLPHKTSANLHAEQQRKHMKRTRSALQFLSDGINRTSRHGLDDVAEVLPPGQSRQTPPWAPAGVCPEAGTLCRVRNRPCTSSGVGADEATTTETSRQEKIERATGTVRATDAGTPLRLYSSAPVLRSAVAKVAPLLELRPCSSGAIPLKGEKREKAVGRTVENVPSSRRSTVMSVRALRSSMWNPTISSEFRMRLHADRRRRRIDRIISDVGQIEKNNEGMNPPEHPMTIISKRTAADGTNSNSQPISGRGGTGNYEVGATVEGKVEELSPIKHPTSVLSDIVQNVLSKFERLVHGVGNAKGMRGSFHDRVDHSDTVLEKRLREKRTAAWKSAIRHNERYLRAQRFNLNAMKETQQRRHEATVGLSGPSGERFGPYSLEDVFDFQAFASHLGALGVEFLTVRGLMNNPGIQNDPYTHALLQELTRMHVVHWNQPLSLEDLMQLVFHFAKHEELKRMANAVEITLLLERVRDVYLGTEDEDTHLLGPDSTLSPQVTSDIDLTFRANCTESNGTCTLKELAAMMARAGSDLYPHGPEELETLASGCGVNG